MVKNEQLIELTPEILLEKMGELLRYAAGKKNIIEYHEINDFFKGINLKEEDIEKVIEFLEGNHVDIMQVSVDSDDDDLVLPELDMEMEDEEEIDLEEVDLSIPDGVSIEDPVRMYLKEIGKVP
ncbi:MAG: RNA polymerase sigma factor region1.1 domain-containing protein, partial [Lachnospiraceae bacterium]|nr:RNA polymerase sigma factor region1.1 domain-containing protein [Lachnospiraceae bacterium]MDY5742170.1 RNA polymerase sigma factor region1.1 domain-containing protein [Lachnospiraceae bacterium]